MQWGLSTDLSGRLKQNAEFINEIKKIKKTNTGGTDVYETVHAVPKVWTITCWWSCLVCDLCTPHCTFMGMTEKEKDRCQL